MPSTVLALRPTTGAFVLAVAITTGWAALGVPRVAHTADAADARGASRPIRDRPQRVALACIGPACDVTERPAASALPTAEATRADEPADSATLAFWRRFAANALLEPLLEPEGALRWSAPTAMHPCVESSRVSLDGREPSPGQALPERPFELQWELADCRPLGPDGPSLRGRVTMRIERTPGVLRAWVSPHDLEIRQHGERLRADEAFATSLSLAPSPRRE